MKLLYVQNDSFKTLEAVGITRCFFKYFDFSVSGGAYTRKRHFHTNFELHFIINGQQCYEINGEHINVKSAEVLIIPPRLMHCVKESSPDVRKAAITFDYDTVKNKLSLPGSDKHFIMPATEVISADIEFIISESQRGKMLSHGLLENRIYETLISVFRYMGMDEGALFSHGAPTPSILCVAKQFVEDNIELSPSVGELALYCSMSEKQLSRIFKRYEGVSAFEYIRRGRVEKIKQLLEENELTLKEISDRMNFSNEYYFNAFFKSAAGMPPGTYRSQFSQ